MKRSVFILGRTPDLAFLELQSLYPAVVRLAADMAYVDMVVDAADMAKLGGTVKLIHVIEEISQISQVAIARVLGDYIVDGKITYCNDCSHPYCNQTLDLPHKDEVFDKDSLW